MKFSSLAIAALIGAMNINDVAALQKKHHHHQPHHHAKMQTFEEPAVKATVEADPQLITVCSRDLGAVDPRHLI